MSEARKIGRVTPPKLDNELGEFLANARIRKALTLQEVATHLGLNSGQSVWDWENGKGSGIPAEALLRLVKLYGISAADAYDQLIQFHQEKARAKVHAKFESARIKILGRKK